MNQRYFIAGTDTGVGKTYITEQWLLQAKREGLHVLGLKPIASGSVKTQEGLRNEDALRLQAASSQKLPYAMINPFAFEPPIAPHLAAHAVQARLSVREVVDALMPSLALEADLICVEGVGGWAVPLNAKERMSDVVKALELPVILVVGMRLGCLNHALLTRDAILASGCEFAGWVANRIDPSMVYVEENIETLEREFGKQRVGYG